MDYYCDCSENSTVVRGRPGDNTTKESVSDVHNFGHDAKDNYEIATPFELGQGMASRAGHLDPFGSVTGGGGYGKINDLGKSLRHAD